MSDTVLIRISQDLATFFGTRDENGRKLSFELGEPVEYVSSDSCAPLEPPYGCDATEPVFEPTITATDDGMSLVPKE